jgi:hypothetical protein
MRDFAEREIRVLDESMIWKKSRTDYSKADFSDNYKLQFPSAALIINQGVRSSLPVDCLH